jgi:hypothetical protein
VKAYYPSWIELAILAYCVWQAWDLEWASTPSMRRGGLALALWCMPVFFNQWQAFDQRRPKGATPSLLFAAVLFSAVGSMGSLHVLTHVGLACALAGLIPWSWPMALWLPSAVTWMPAFGWLLRDLSIPMIQLVQFACVLLGTVVMLFWQWRR